MSERVYYDESKAVHSTKYVEKISNSKDSKFHFSPQLFVIAAMCLILLIGLLLSGAIVLALIPLYLSQKSVTDSGPGKH